MSQQREVYMLRKKVLIFWTGVGEESPLPEEDHSTLGCLYHT